MVKLSKKEFLLKNIFTKFQNFVKNIYLLIFSSEGGFFTKQFA